MIPAIQRIVSLLDYTSLDETDTPATIAALCQKAVTPVGPVAAICVYPRFIAQAKKALAGTGIKIATVVNFPSGEAAPPAVAADVLAARQEGADEIDVVFPYGAFLAGDDKRAEAVLAASRQACGAGKLKVILESGAFGSDEKLSRAAQMAIKNGADFLKTSTGKRQPGATLGAAKILLEACRSSPRRVGFKASGGIRDQATAQTYLDLADYIIGPTWATPDTFRFGASSLLDSLLKTTGESVKLGTY